MSTRRPFSIQRGQAVGRHHKISRYAMFTHHTSTFLQSSSKATSKGADRTLSSPSQSVSTPGQSANAISPRLQLSPQELKEVVTAFNDTNEPKAVQASGLHLAGEKYFVIMANEKSLYGKKVGWRQPLSQQLPFRELHLGNSWNPY